RLASCLWVCDGDHEAACLVLTQPAGVEIPRNHLTLRHDVDVTHGGRRYWPAYAGSAALGRTFNRHWRLFCVRTGESLPRLVKHRQCSRLVRSAAQAKGQLIPDLDLERTGVGPK